MYSSQRIKDLLIVSECEHRPLRGDRTRYQVYFKYVPVASFYEDDLASQKIAAIHLVESGIANIVDAADVVGLHRNTVSNALKVKAALGISSVVKDDRGLKGPLHYTSEIQTHIVKLLESREDWTDEQVARQAAKDLNTRVSRQAVARIRVEHTKPPQIAAVPSKKELMELEIAARRIEKEVGHQVQLSLDFKNRPELKDDIGAFSEENAPEPSSNAEAAVINQLEKGVATPYAGLFFYHVFISELNFCKLFEGFELNGNGVFTAQDICLSIFFGIAARLPSIEAHKLVNASQFGLLFSVAKSPDPSTIRTYLSTMAEENRSESLIDMFAIQSLAIGAIDEQAFFIDGHFLPYYGLNLLAKGYHTVRRQVLKGNETYVVSDINKRPLMFITEGCEIDFRPIIDRVVDKIISYGVHRPLMVFDRGAYGVHFFSQIVLKTDFITWGKYIRQEELDAITEEQFIVGLRFGDKCYEISQVEKTLVESASTAKKEGRTERSEIKIRMIVIRSIDERTGGEIGKRLSVITSDFTRESWQIGCFMLNRWGKSENFFKEIQAIFNYNYHPGYEINEMEQQPLFDNPEVLIIKKSLKTIEKEIRALEGEQAILKLEYQQEAKKRTAKKIDSLTQKIREKKEDKEGLENNKEQLPAKVTLETFLGKPMSICDLEKKRLYDLLQITAYHARERLVDEFSNCYNRKQDIKQILDKIIEKGGHIRLIGDRLVVLLDWIERPAHRKAAQELCRHINRLVVEMQGRLPFKLFFAISRTPLAGV